MRYWPERLSSAHVSLHQAEPEAPAVPGRARARKIHPGTVARTAPRPVDRAAQELHILTREGKLNQDTRRKLKQVNHLLQFIEPLLQESLDARGDVSLVDHGAGKSYLGFMLYDLFFAQREVGWVYGIETRAELVERSRALAGRLGFARMGLSPRRCREAMTSDQIPAQVDVVTALHACDTATDDAIAFGLARNARCMVLVPRCQAEVASVLRKHKALSLSRTP